MIKYRTNQYLTLFMTTPVSPKVANLSKCA